VYSQNIDSTLSQFQNTSKNTIFFEALGNGFLYSVNYDRLVTPNIAVRIGFSILPIIVPDVNSLIMSVPISASYLHHFPNSPSNIELGLGFSTVNSTSDGYPPAHILGRKPFSETFVFVVPMLGYRLQPKQGGFNFRVLWTPLTWSLGIETTTSKPPAFWYWFGLGLGHTF
jgi:hypothetical protein